MKFFAIGDGHKRVSLPDRYLYEIAADGTAIFWVPKQVDIPIRVSCLTIQPNDEKEDEAGFWAVINKANAAKQKTKIEGDKAIYRYREASTEDKDITVFYEIGMGNALVIVTVTVDKEHEESAIFTQVMGEVDTMIASIKSRDEEEVFVCELTGSDHDEIREYSEEIRTPDEPLDSDQIQVHYDRALSSKDMELGAKVGLSFGEFLRSEIPQFQWHLTVDDWGCARSLNFGDSGISVFPENMILKRIEAGESLSIEELASDTIQTVEDVFRDNPPEG
ncbi:MAG: DUF3806 domain-containing protein [Verrucomicrobiota bacterium]